MFLSKLLQARAASICRVPEQSLLSRAEELVHLLLHGLDKAVKIDSGGYATAFCGSLLLF